MITLYIGQSNNVLWLGSKVVKVFYLLIWHGLIVSDNVHIFFNVGHR